MADIRDDRLLAEAICYAAEAHFGQRRKGCDVPFIVHPMEVAAIAASMTEDRHVIAAAVLHDVLEDTPSTAAAIRDLFGEDVLSLIMGDTEDKREEMDPRDSWLLRKQETVDYVKNRAALRERIVVLSDKLANLRSMARDFDRLGSALWERFHQKDPAMHKWYYLSVVRACEGLEDTDAYRECLTLIGRLFGE